MSVSSESREDQIRGWRNEAVTLWRELYREPPELDEEYDPEDIGYLSWSMGREATQVNLAVSAMDVDLAREIDDIQSRTMGEVMIRDRQGNPDELARILDRSLSITNPKIRSKAIAGICAGVRTPAWALDLGLLGQALRIPSELDDHYFAVSTVLDLLEDPVLMEWLEPPRDTFEWVVRSQRTLDPNTCCYALELAFLESGMWAIRRVISAIVR